MKPGDDGLGNELAKLYELSGYYPAYVRQLTGLPGRRRYFVVPAYGRSEAVVPANCMPAAARRELVEEQQRRRVEPVDCIIEVGGSENAPTLGCEPFAAIEEGGRVFQSDSLIRQPTIELVPDGVASVRIAYREASTIGVGVSENAFLFTPPPVVPRVAAELKRLEPKLFAPHLSAAERRRITLKWNQTASETSPKKIEWLDGAGRTVRIINSPNPRSGLVTSVGSLRAPVEG